MFVEPRALRWRALRLSRERSEGPDGPLQAVARRGLRRRGQAPHHDRHLCAVGRLLRRLLPEGAARASADQRGLQARLPGSRRAHGAHRARRRLRHRRQGVGSDPDVSQRHLHHRREPGGRAGHVHSLRFRARPAGGPADRRPAFRGRRSCSTWRTRTRRKPTGIAGSRPHSRRRCCRDHPHFGLGNRHRPRDPRAAVDEVEDLLRLAHGLWRRAELPGEPRRPRVSRRVAGAQRAKPCAWR